MRRCVRATVWALAALCLAAPAHGQTGVSIITDVVYGHKDGLALTFDVFTPDEANGAGVLFIMSSGWESWWNRPDEDGALPQHESLLRSGFTVFRVRHGSAPRYKVPDAYADVRRAVRFIRLNSTAYGVDPNRLGVTGGSAGGHLALMLGLAADDGDPTADDEILKGSSKVAAVVARFAPIDLRAHRTHSESSPPDFPNDAMYFASGVVRSLLTGQTFYSALVFDDVVAASISPILHVSADDPPTLLIHGDADRVVDPNNSRVIHEALANRGVETDLVVVVDGPHGFEEPEHNRQSREAMVAWFERHLGL